MLTQLLPPRADNRYGGHAAALWVLGVLLLLKSGIALPGCRVRAGMRDGVDRDRVVPAW